MFLYDRENAVAYGSAQFGPGTGPIIYDDLVCTGNESDLSDCRHAVLDHTNCHHSKDVGVSCSKSFEIFMDYNYVTSTNCFPERDIIFHRGKTWHLVQNYI